jgi:hypothetical protein
LARRARGRVNVIGRDARPRGPGVRTDVPKVITIGDVFVIELFAVARTLTAPGYTRMRHPTVLFLMLAGLADGLAPKERRYRPTARLAPTTWVPRFHSRTDACAPTRD